MVKLSTMFHRGEDVVYIVAERMNKRRPLRRLYYYPSTLKVTEARELGILEWGFSTYVREGLRVDIESKNGKMIGVKMEEGWLSKPRCIITERVAKASVMRSDTKVKWIDGKWMCKRKTTKWKKLNSMVRSRGGERGYIKVRYPDFSACDLYRKGESK